MILPRRPRAAALSRAAAVLTAALAAAASLLTAAPAQAQSQAPAGCTGHASDTWVNVAVEDVRNGNGLVAVTLYADDASRFLAHHGSLYVGRVEAHPGTTRVCLFVPKPGVYGIAVYHDENANRKIDRSALGLPREGFGFSNDPSTLAGIPSFRSVRLAIPRTGLTTHIHLRYP